MTEIAESLFFLLLVLFSCDQDALEEAGRQPVSAASSAVSVSHGLSSLSVIFVICVGVSYWEEFWKRSCLLG